MYLNKCIYWIWNFLTFPKHRKGKEVVITEGASLPPSSFARGLDMMLRSNKNRNAHYLRKVLAMYVSRGKQNRTFSFFKIILHVNSICINLCHLLVSLCPLPDYVIYEQVNDITMSVYFVTHTFVSFIAIFNFGAIFLWLLGKWKWFNF